MKTFTACLALVGTLLLAGCAQTHQFRVDALADPVLAENRDRFLLEDGFSESPGARLRYREAAQYVTRALEARGFVTAQNPAAAEFIVTVAASVSDPLSDTERSMEPMYYRTWGHSEIIHTPVVDARGNVRYVATRIYTPPQTHFAGYTGRDRSVVVYRKELELTARTPDGEEIWTVNVSTVERDSDLRGTIPYLAAAATPYLGQATDGAVAVRLRENDEMVEYLRRPRRQ